MFVKAWETSETWDHIQFNGFLDLAQYSNQSENRGKTFNDVYPWSEDLKVSMAICRCNETNSEHTHP